MTIEQNIHATVLDTTTKELSRLLRHPPAVNHSNLSWFIIEADIITIPIVKTFFPNYRGYIHLSWDELIAILAYSVDVDVKFHNPEAAASAVREFLS
jgi:hypothetical protein